MQVYTTIERKKKSPRVYYGLASLAGVSLFIGLLYSFKALAFVLKAILKYWLIIVAVIIGAVILKKILFRRKRRYADLPQQV